MKVRIGVGLSVGNMLESPEDFCSVVDILEDLAFDSLWMSDTVVGPAFDPMTALSFAAGRTTRLKLGTSVAVLPGRDPFLLAKQIALLDRLSGGRFLPAFGLGSPSPADRVPFGVQPGGRAEAFEENLSIIRQLWAQGGSVPHPRGGAPATIDPCPTKNLDVWFGGRSEAALERTGRLSDGWLGSFQTPEEGGASKAAIVSAATAAGRSIDDGHFGTTIYYSRARRSEVGAGNVMRAMRYCGCAPSTSLESAPLSGTNQTAELMFPQGEDELTDLISRHVTEGLTKFVVIPADRPGNWDEELSWLRAVTAQLES